MMCGYNFDSLIIEFWWCIVKMIDVNNFKKRFKLLFCDVGIYKYKFWCSVVLLSVIYDDICIFK